MLRVVPDELLTYEQLGVALGGPEKPVSETTLRKWKRQGMPHVRLGDRLVRFRLSEVLGWLERYERNAA